MKKNNTKGEYKLFHIVIGLTIGFFMGSVIVYFGFNRQNVSSILEDIEFIKNQMTIFAQNNSDINYHQNIIKNNGIHGISTLPKDSIEKKDSGIQNKKTQTQPVLNKSEYNLLNHKVKDYNSDEKESVAQLIDTDYPDTSIFFPSMPINITHDIKVEKDKLVDIKAFFYPSSIFHSTFTSYPELDSIMGKKNTTHDSDILYVEFWESPLSTKGYKKGRNKIMLYGVSLHDFVSFKLHNNVLYLKYLNQYYPLEISSDFKLLNPVSDILLIEELQEL